MLHALVTADGILDYRAFDGLPPDLPVAKGLRWLPVTDIRPDPGPGKVLVGPVIAVTETEVIRSWAAHPAPVPATVSPIQARVALARAGLLGTVEEAVRAAGEEVAVAWEYAHVLERHSPLIDQVVAALSWTDGQVDDLFRTAAVLVL